MTFLQILGIVPAGWAVVGMSCHDVGDVGPPFWANFRVGDGGPLLFGLDVRHGSYEQAGDFIQMDGVGFDAVGPPGGG